MKMSISSETNQIINGIETPLETCEMPVTFAAGPSKVPTAVKQRILSEFSNFMGSKLSILETFHRSKEFLSLIKTCEGNLRSLLGVPSTHHILFLQGGGTGQFAAIPMNLLGGSKDRAYYLATCSWSKKAFNEAKKYGNVQSVCPQVDGNEDDFICDSEAAYFYYCDNDTVGGVEFSAPPKVPCNVPIVCDMSSNLLSKPVDVSKYGIIFAGTQKNFGCAGCVIVIIRDDLLDQSLPICPSILNYRMQVTAGSIANTPPIFSIFVCNIMCEWVIAQGGLAEMDKRCQRHSSSIYSVMDNAKGFYRPLVAKEKRSRVNLVMQLANPEMDDLWLAEATTKGLLSLKGYRSVGGIRISMYNGINLEDVNRLRGFMLNFQQQHQ